MGTCYPDAVRIARKLGDTAVVVHGKVFQPRQKRWINHAWVEHEGRIYDSLFTDGVAAARYRRLLKAKPAKRYNVWRALALAVGKGHWGPWDGAAVQAHGL